MPIQAVKGTRDLYPELFAPLRHIFDVWRSVSLRHGFVEFEGPELEYLDLYREKSGEELVGQLYRLTDSGGRELALRPEMTPTLARMVAARLSALPRPIKWFSIPRLFRGENVQRGRLREFFQWNVDVIGSAEMAADAEVIVVGVEALRELGLTASDFRVHISSRRLMSALLAALGVPADSHPAAYPLLDKAGTLPAAELERRWRESFGRFVEFKRLESLLAAPDIAALKGAMAAAKPTAQFEEASNQLTELFVILQNFGISEFCKLDLHVVRGLAYYTGPVFEFYDVAARERAICGGGRYDDLLGKLGRSKEPAVGFGMGDVVLALILQERGLLDVRPREGGVFVVDAAEGLRPLVFQLVAALRRAGLCADFSYVAQALGRQLRLADRQGARAALILGQETLDRRAVQVKDLRTGQSKECVLDALLNAPRESLREAGLSCVGATTS